jgi:hypothetical protein
MAHIGCNAELVVRLVVQDDQDLVFERVDGLQWTNNLHEIDPKL